MGYYSQVKLLAELPERDIEAEAEILKSFEVFERVEINKEKHLILAAVDFIKWYDTISEVQNAINWINTLANRLDESEETGGLHFVRIGEELTDIEEFLYGEVNYFLNIMRYCEDGEFE